MCAFGRQAGDPGRCLGLTLAWSSQQLIRSQGCAWNGQGVTLMQRSLKHTRLSLSVLQVRTEREQTAEKRGQRVLGCRAVWLGGGPLTGAPYPQPGSHCADPAASAHPCTPTPADSHQKSLTSQDPGTARALPTSGMLVPVTFGEASWGREDLAQASPLSL